MCPIDSPSSLLSLALVRIHSLVYLSIGLSVCRFMGLHICLSDCLSVCWPLAVQAVVSDMFPGMKQRLLNSRVAGQASRAILISDSDSAPSVSGPL
jgi:hypothetical protein